MAEALEQRPHVGVEHTLIRGLVLVSYRCAALLEARVVKRRIKPSKAAQRCRDQLRHLRALRDIGHDEQALRSRCLDCGGSLLPPHFGGSQQSRYLSLLRASDAAR